MRLAPLMAFGFLLAGCVTQPSIRADYDRIAKLAKVAGLKVD